MVLTEEAAVMEPAVGLGCILGSAHGGGRKIIALHQNKQIHIQHCCLTARQSATGNTEEKQEGEEEEEERSGHISCFSKGHSPPPLDKMTFKEIYNWI